MLRTGVTSRAKSLAVSGQCEPPVWSGAQECGADGGLELADLAGEEGVPDAELAGCALEAGLPGDREESSDALLGARVGEGVPDVRGERAGPAEGGEGVGAAGDAVPDADAGVAGCGGEGLDRDAGLGGDVLEAALAVLVLLAQPVRVDAAARGRGRLAESCAGEELPDGALAASGDAGDLARAVSLAGEVAELVGAGWFRLGRGRRGAAAAGSWGAGWRAAASRTWSAVVASRAAMARTGSPARMSGCRSSVLMASGSGPGQGMPVAQSNGGSQVTGSLMLALESSARACWCRQKAICSGMVNTNSA